MRAAMEQVDRFDGAIHFFSTHRRLISEYDERRQFGDILDYAVENKRDITYIFELNDENEVCKEIYHNTGEGILNLQAKGVDNPFNMGHIGPQHEDDNSESTFGAGLKGALITRAKNTKIYTKVNTDNYEYKIEYDNDILTKKNLPANISNSPPIYKQEPQRHSEFNLIVGEYKLPLEGTLITMEKFYNQEVIENGNIEEFLNNKIYTIQSIYNDYLKAEDFTLTLQVRWQNSYKEPIAKELKYSEGYFPDEDPLKVVTNLMCKTKKINPNSDNIDIEYAIAEITYCDEFGIEKKEHLKFEQLDKNQKNKLSYNPKLIKQNEYIEKKNLISPSSLVCLTYTGTYSCQSPLPKGDTEIFRNNRSYGKYDFGDNSRNEYNKLACRLDYTNKSINHLLKIKHNKSIDISNRMNSNLSIILTQLQRHLKLKPNLLKPTTPKMTPAQMQKCRVYKIEQINIEKNKAGKRKEDEEDEEGEEDEEDEEEEECSDNYNNLLTPAQSSPTPEPTPPSTPVPTSPPTPEPTPPSTPVPTPPPTPEPTPPSTPVPTSPPTPEPTPPSTPVPTPSSSRKLVVVDMDEMNSNLQNAHNEQRIEEFNEELKKFYDDMKKNGKTPIEIKNIIINMLE
jgi:hypothetical protein